VKCPRSFLNEAILGYFPPSAAIYRSCDVVQSIMLWSEVKKFLVGLCSCIELVHSSAVAVTNLKSVLYLRDLSSRTSIQDIRVTSRMAKRKIDLGSLSHWPVSNDSEF
jgi:hypothetical protein